MHKSGYRETDIMKKKKSKKKMSTDTGFLDDS